MKIQVGGLSEGVHEYHFQAKAREIGLGEEFAGNVDVKAMVEKTGSQLFLEASLRTVATFCCDRCVSEFQSVLAPSYHMNYVWNGAESGNLDPAEVQVIPAGLNIVDITDDVRQTLLLSIPLKLLCRADCRGLCPHCGKNLNDGPCDCADTALDSRWDTLSSLKKGSTQEPR